MAKSVNKTNPESTVTLAPLPASTFEDTPTVPAVAPKKTAISNLVMGNADDTMALANELQRFVQQNKLTTTIQGKEYPNVEAWMFAGTLLGLTAMLESIEDKSTDTEIKWHAMVKLVKVATGEVVGRGFATCSNKEHTKRLFADYAICSMSQTRAVGKAYRITFGWLMKAAGFEATPMEELSEVNTSAEVLKEPPKSSAGANEQASTAPAQPTGVVPSNPPVITSPAPAPTDTTQYATPEQKEEIMRLLNNPTITKPERVKMLLSINKLEAERADQVITKMVETIELRENGQPFTAGGSESNG